ncbi:MAG: pyruvate formate-lyase 1-activating enzyme, partial [bacterium]|nr:pyruvate formate-lyase 1-activating enzyme [Candidatus Colisoma equi]
RASLPLVDWYLYDCKETDAELYRKWTGVDNGRILANLAILDEANAQVVLRCPIVPGCNDRKDHFGALGEMSRQFPCIRRIEVLPYHPLGVRKSRELGLESPCESIPFPTESDVELWKNTIGGMAVCPVCRG